MIATRRKEQIPRKRNKIRATLIEESFPNMSVAAEAAGLKASKLYGYTTGGTTPGRQGMKRLAKPLNISLRELRDLLQMLDHNAAAIFIETREQRPYQFNSSSELGCLGTGDYSIAGYENEISIERKTPDDLIGCLTVGRGRFERELERGRSLPYFALVVECSLSDIIEKRYRFKALPHAMIQSLLAFSVRYRLPIHFCENRKNAGRITESFLEKFVRDQEKNNGVS